MANSKRYPVADLSSTTAASVLELLDFLKISGVRGDLDEFEESMTRQEFAEECDINTIMARYEAGGAVSHVNKANPVFLDTTLYPGLQASMDAFREASASFAALPATVRREFDNDPQKFVDFAIDPDNIERMREWGLAEPAPKEPAPVRVEFAPGSFPDLEGREAPLSAGGAEKPSKPR